MASNNQTIKAEHLTVDPPVVTICHKPSFTQSWALASFVSPNDRVKQRFIYEANRFLYHDINKQIMDTTNNLVKNINNTFDKVLEQKINTYKSSSDPIYKAAAALLEETKKDIQLNEDEQVEKTLRTYRIDQEDLTDRLESYQSINHKELESDFNTKFTDETSIRGFKIRGVFEDLTEAKAKAKKIHEEIEPFVHTYVLPVGYWVPWDPNVDAIQDQEYMVSELNDLMAQKKHNAEQKDEFFAKRKQMMIDDAKESNNKEVRDKLKQKIKDRQASRGKK